MKTISVSVWLLLLLLTTGFSNAAHGQSREVIVGVYHNPPKLFLADGRISGIHGDLLTHIAQQHDWEITVRECHWSQCLEWLQNDQLDLLPDVADEPSRRQFLDFHQEPALLSWSQLYASAGQQISSLLDLEGKRVAVLSDSVQQKYLKNLANSFDLEIDIFFVDSYAEGFAAVKDGKVDAVATNQFYGNQQVAESSVAMTPIMFLPNKLYFATGARDNGGLLTAIDNELSNLKSNPDSVYYQILDRWNVQPETFVVPNWVWSVGTVLLLLSLFLLAFNRLLKKAVNEKTRALSDSEHKLETILNSVDAYIFIKSPELKYQYVNKKVAELFGCRAEDIIGFKDSDFFASETAQELADNDQQVIKTGRRMARHELNQMPGESNKRAFWSVKVALQDSSGETIGLCGISTDISEYEELKSQVKQLAYFDVLTGLANRRLLLEKVDYLYQHSDSQRENALVVLDIDKFKNINDALGHELGDLLLQQLASRLEQVMQQHELAGRLASDEFFILLEQLPAERDTRQQHLQERLQKFRAQLDKPYQLGAKTQQVSVSLGVSFFDESTTADSLLKAVDLAMSKAKSVGGGVTQFFNQGLQHAFNRQLRLENELRLAIQHKDLTIHLQPQFEQRGLNTECIGFEALLRWQHAQLGAVSPAEFIPVAELTGQMPALHSLVLEQAVAALEQLQKRPNYQDCTVAVNVSASQFKQSNFLTELEQTLSSSVHAKNLELELTESILVDDTDDTAKLMDILNSQGLQFSLDDFGTGYSSLSYLKRLPLRQLKIDQSFVRDLLQDAHDEAIVKTIIALANSLGLEVLAEGVETDEQREKLLELGCKRYQGYLLGHPQPLEYWLNQ
ncbi:MAG: EAL domain-containing protein [Pseudomonadota bacterium]